MTAFMKAKADPVDSTFRHVISFDIGQSLVGYSKKIDFNEPKDKRKLLCGIIGRLSCDFLFPGKKSNPRGAAWQIEIYRRTKTTTGTDPIINEELVGIFDDVSYEMRGAFGNDRLVRSFLIRLYETQDKAKAEALIKDPKVSGNVFAFDSSTETYQDLQTKCANLRDMDFPIAEVERFFFAMKRRYFTPDGQPCATAPTAASPPTPAPAQKRGGDALSIGALMGNFNPAQ